MEECRPLNIGRLFCIQQKVLTHDSHDLLSNPSSSDSEESTGSEDSSGEQMGGSWQPCSARRLEEDELDLFIQSKHTSRRQSFAELLRSRRVSEAELDSLIVSQLVSRRQSFSPMPSVEKFKSPGVVEFVVDSMFRGECYVSPFREARRNLTSEFSSIHLSPLTDSPASSLSPLHDQPVVSSFSLPSEEDKEHSDTQASSPVVCSEFPSRNIVAPISHWRGDQLIYDNSGTLVGCSLKDEDDEPTVVKRHTGVQSTLVVDPKSGREGLREVVFPKGAWHFSEGTSRVVETEHFQVSVVSLSKSASFSITAEHQTVCTVLRSDRAAIEFELDGDTVQLSCWDTFVVPKSSVAVVHNRSSRASAKVQLSVYKSD
jgi:hypothetical protein